MHAPSAPSPRTQNTRPPLPLLLPLPPAQFYADPLQRGAIGSVTVDGVARSWSWGAAKENVLKLTELNWSAAVRRPLGSLPPPRPPCLRPPTLLACGLETQPRAGPPSASAQPPAHLARPH
jgi:hypothetical protein